eukprot:2350697-Rhodomonas_salina.1
MHTFPVHRSHSAFLATVYLLGHWELLWGKHLSTLSSSWVRCCQHQPAAREAPIRLSEDPSYLKILPTNMPAIKLWWNQYDALCPQQLNMIC